MASKSARMFSTTNVIVAWSVCTDIICALLPILILWKSQMNKRVKYALWAIMGVGVLYVNLGVAVHDEHIKAKQSMTALACVALSK